MAKTDKELAVDLTIAMLNHNAQLHDFTTTQGAVGRSIAPFMNAKNVSQQYLYFLSVVEGKTDPWRDQKSESSK